MRQASGNLGDSQENLSRPSHSRFAKDAPASVAAHDVRDQFRQGFKVSLAQSSECEAALSEGSRAVYTVLKCPVFSSAVRDSLCAL